MLLTVLVICSKMCLYGFISQFNLLLLHIGRAWMVTKPSCLSFHAGKAWRSMACGPSTSSSQGPLPTDRNSCSQSLNPRCLRHWAAKDLEDVCCLRNLKFFGKYTAGPIKRIKRVDHFCCCWPFHFGLGQD